MNTVQNNSKSKISVLIPAYERGDYLITCLNSIGIQEGFNEGDITIIISDDASKADLKEIYNDFCKKFPKYNCIYTKNIQNLGMVGNWNKLLDMVETEYYIFISDDDALKMPYSLKKIYDTIIYNNLDGCYGMYEVFDDNGNLSSFPPHEKKMQGKNIIYIDTLEEQIVGHSISFGGIMYKNKGLRYDTKAGVYADWAMNLKYLTNNGKIGCIPEYLFCYRNHGEQGIKKISALKFLKNAAHIMYSLDTNLINKIRGITWCFGNAGYMILLYIKAKF